MKKLYLLLLVSVSMYNPTKGFTQGIVTPVLAWENDYLVASEGKGFMDYTDDACITAFSSSIPYQTSFYSVNPDGINNYSPTGWFFNDHQLAGIHNDGNITYAAGVDIDAGTTNIIILDNDGETELGSYSVSVPGGYDVIESIGTKYNNLPWATFPSSITVVTSVLNLITNNEEVLVSRIGIDPLSWSFGSTQIVVEILASRAGIPVAIETDELNNIYVWGDVERNAAGTIHDCFLLKLNPDLVPLYTRFHSSYTGRDDLAVGLVIDGSGNLYGVASSQNMDAPYYDHAAIFKLNKNTGKRTWLKRVGVSSLGDTGTHGVGGDVCGNGLAITGNTANATNYDVRTWRIDANGNILWNRVLNTDTEPGSLETGSNLAFCEVSCDVVVVGFRRCAYPMCGGVFISRFGADILFPVLLIDEEGLEYYGDTQLQINYASLDNSFYVAGLGFTATDDLWFHKLMKFDQVELKNELASDDRNEIIVSPNPAIDVINVENIEPGNLIQITDVNGKLMAEYISETTTKLAVGHLVPGIYFIRVSDNISQQTSSFIKMK